MVTESEVHKDCEKMGAGEVHKAIAGNAWGADRKRFAKGWLNAHDESRKELSSLEQSRIARSAKNAAWTAAIAAIIAAIAAAISVYLAFNNNG